MADYGFARAATWEELLRVHEQWMDDDNAQMHWAHQRREDGRRSPAAVLDRAVGRPIDEPTLHRVLGPEGYARFRHWKLYGERGLAGRAIGRWLYSPQLTLEYREEPLAQYRVTYTPGKRQCKVVALHRLFETPFRSPQPPLVALDDDQWLKAFRAATYAPRRQPRPGAGVQLPLFSQELLNALSS